MAAGRDVRRVSFDHTSEYPEPRMVTPRPFAS
jgi:hypothetical protein